LLVCAAGCAALSGLDTLREDDCVPSCEGGSPDDDALSGDETGNDDGTVEPDAGSPPDVTLGDAPVDRTTPPNDAPNDGDAGSAADALHDAAADAGEASPGDASADHDAAPPVEASVEASTDTGAADAADAGHDAGGDAEAGCGPTNTIANCGACGRACSTAQASSTMCGSNRTCMPTCNPGHLSCNNPAAPTADDGCECATPNAPSPPSCCATACPVQHNYDQSAGASATFYDCVAQGTYNAQLAMDACLAYAGAGQCNVAGSYHCAEPDGGGNLGDLVCSDGNGAPSCICWGYDNSVQGFLYSGPGVGSVNCFCPGAGDPHWN
jgi:hypothetical protein